MEVILKSINHKGNFIEECLTTRAKEENFLSALKGMKVPDEALANMTILVEFIDIIPDGAMKRLSDNQFLIALRRIRADSSFNETVAHELKHIAIEILSPKQDRKDGKKDGPYKWEEVNCTRAEKRWGQLEYFEFLKTGRR